MAPDVVCTGIGLISPIGLAVDKVWDNCCAGTTGVSEVTLFPTDALAHHQAGEVKNFRAANYMAPNRYRRMDRFSQLAVAAAGLALKDAQLTVDSEKATVVGSVMSTTFGPSSATDRLVQDLKAGGPAVVSPSIFPNTVLNVATGQVSVEFSLKGPSSTLAGISAIPYALELLRADKAETMLVCGAEELDPTIYQAYSRLGILSMVHIGEGASVLVLETTGSARKRKARAYSFICGYGAVADNDPLANVATAAPGVDTFLAAMNQALTRAGVEPQQIGAVVIAANGGAVDAAEEKALAALFGQSDPPHRVPAKRLTGESLACHSVIGTALASVMIHKGEIPMCGAEAGTVPMIAAKPFILVNSFELGGGVVAIVVGPPSVPQTEGYA